MSDGVVIDRVNPGTNFARPSTSGALSSSLNAIVSQLFRAGLALDALQHSAETDYGKSRAAVAAAALDEALCELRGLATTLEVVDIASLDDL